jgi:hypothetical protein
VSAPLAESGRFRPEKGPRPPLSSYPGKWDDSSPLQHAACRFDGISPPPTHWLGWPWWQEHWHSLRSDHCRFCPCPHGSFEMATVIYRDGSAELTYDFYEVATADWSQIDHVELNGPRTVLVSASPAEFWRQVRVLAQVQPSYL